MFQILGVLLALYVVRCLVTGEVFAKQGIWGRTIRRSEEAFQYWGVIACYFGLVLALFLLFPR